MGAAHMENVGAAPMLDGGASRMEDGRCNTWDTGCDYVCDYVCDSGWGSEFSEFSEFSALPPGTVFVTMWVQWWDTGCGCGCLVVRLLAVV